MTKPLSCPEILRKQVDKIREEAKEQLPEKIENAKKAVEKEYSSFGKQIIGVFGGYRSSSGKGEEIIIGLAKIFAKMDYVVITGKGVFYKFKGKITQSTILTNGILNLMPIDNKQKCEFLAGIPRKAIFILSPERDASQYESSEFISDKGGDKEIGIGIMIYGKKLLPCSYITKDVVDSTEFYKCNAIGVVACKENLHKCPFINQLKISFTEIEQYVNSSFMRMVIVKKKEDISKIIDAIFSQKYQL